MEDSSIQDSSRQQSKNQSYSGVVTTGSSRFHAGNVYNNNYNCDHRPGLPATASKYEERWLVEELLSSLAFENMDDPYDTIARELPGTCEWVVSCPEYMKWQAPISEVEPSACLWIKGKPGAGKSTIMKSLIRHTEKTRRDVKLVAWFFNARGHVLERTTEGMYRAMLHQLARDQPGLCEQVFKTLGRLKTLGDLGIQEGQDYQTLGLWKAQNYKKNKWPLQVLKDLCYDAVLHWAGSCRVMFFVDALDEVDTEDDIRDMVTFFEDLTEAAVTTGPRLSICLTSRHYPRITMNRSLDLILDDQEGHTVDIIRYVKCRLRLKQEQLKHKLAQSIILRASGIFIWVVLVVRILNKEADHGNQHLLQDKLQQIPNELNDLFRQLVMKGDIDERFLPTILWALFTPRPLNAEEMYYGVMVGLQQLTAESSIWNTRLADPVMLAEYISSSSKGFLEVREDDCSPRSGVVQVVQFIHESVRQFFTAQGLLMLDDSICSDVAATGHERLAQWCQDYLKLVLRVTHYPDDPYQDQQLYPLLGYVKDHTLWHAEMAARKGLKHPILTDVPWAAQRAAILSWNHSHGSSCSTLFYMFVLLETKLPNSVKSAFISQFKFEEQQIDYLVDRIAINKTRT